MGKPGFGYIISEFFAPNIKMLKNIVGFPPGIIIIFSGDISTLCLFRKSSETASLSGKIPLAEV